MGITAADDDAGIDGIIVALDGEIVVSLDESEEIFKRPKHQFEAEIVLTQLKTSEHFSKAEITNFSDGVYDSRRCGANESTWACSRGKPTVRFTEKNPNRQTMSTHAAGIAKTVSSVMTICNASRMREMTKAPSAAFVCAHRLHAASFE